ncbi:MAG TPA: BTAD domain-containing putative transcriptional regulator [Acidimicrobiales bacterium]|nr:BTAD domain-containing putative transcriptional regulator [Acidimicrobiales bacterium]
MIARPRLERRLDGALGRRLTCVVAGPGFGKTTLLTRWAAGTASAWHGLGPGDRTLGGLVRRVTDVLRARVPGLPPELLAAARAARGPDTGTDEAGRAQAYAARMCEALAAALRRDLVLVLDDLEAIDGAPESVAFVAGLCRQAPPTLHVVLASRSDPPFPLARLRGQGQVLDMVAADLAFTAAETGDVVDATVGAGAGRDDAGADDELVAEVHRVTAGWPAAVRLVGEALVHGAPDGRLATLERLRRPGGTLYAYLADEVLATEPAEVRGLLGLLAALDRFTPDLAAALGPPGTDAALAGLVRRGLLVATPGAGQEWLTLNALIRSVLAGAGSIGAGGGADAGGGDAVGGDAVGARTEAARWFERHGQPADALRCVLGTDPAPVADAGGLRRFVARWGARLLADGEAELVLAAVERIGPDERNREVRRVEGEARQLVGDWDGALACFEAAAAGADPMPPGLAWRTGLIHHLRGDLDTALAVYGRGDLAEGTDERADAALLLAWSATARWLRGEGDACRRLAADAMDRARRSGDDRALAAAHTALALVAALDGDRLANDGHYLRALDHAERAGDLLQIIRIRLNRGSRLNEEGLYDEAITELDLAIGMADLGGYAVFKGMALGNRGEARGNLGQLELAVDDLESSKAIFQRLGSMMVSYPLGQLADVYRARGQVALARMAWNEAADMARRSGDLQGLVPALAGLARLLAAEDPAAAQSLAREAIDGGFGLGQVDALIARGWVLAAGDEAGRPEAADVAAEALALARDRRDRAGMVEAYELQAATASSAGEADSAPARALLLEALALAEDLRSPLRQGRVLLALAGLGDADSASFARRAERLLRPLGARRLAEEAARLGAAPRPAPAVAIQCLGGFAVIRSGGAVPLAEWKSRKARDLVKMLIARNGRPVHRGVLMDLLWPDEPPERTASRLSVTLSTARAVLDPGKAHPGGWFLAADNDTIGLDVDHVEVDVLRFLELAARALAHRKDGPSPAALDSLEEAESAYVGDAFPEDPYEDWAVSLRERARATYTAVARTLADDAAAAGDSATAVRCYLRVLEHDAFDEGAHLGLVTTQLAAGQQGEARRSYRAYCTRMDELGVEAAPFPT